MSDQSEYADRRKNRRRYEDQFYMTEEEYNRLMDELIKLRVSVANLEQMRYEMQGASKAAKIITPIALAAIGAVVWLYETFQHAVNAAKEISK